MAVRDVVLYPDSRLNQVCEPIEFVDGKLAANDVAIVQDLLDTMQASPGCVGIAAPQLGHLVRMFAIDCAGHPKAKSCAGKLVLINPKITHGETQVKMREGCLSIPDFTADVTRAATISVRALGVDGGTIELQCDAFEARVVLHEYDHLDGLLFLDRVAKARDVFPRKRYR